MRLGKGEYQQACDANTKMRDVNVGNEWEKLNKDDLFWAVVYNVYYTMNKARDMPIAMRPWYKTEWKVQLCKHTAKVYKRYMRRIPRRYRETFSGLSSYKISEFLAQDSFLETDDWYMYWALQIPLRGRFSFTLGEPHASQEEREKYAKQIANKDALVRRRRTSQYSQYKIIRGAYLR
ncbi:hypothetical protein BC629DRAFT_255834 [Irpex lacteus]|nr:hypothetical protein BC629DRAFT_255834 [Irpex lacteus]